MKSHVIVLLNEPYAPILARIVEMGDRYGRDFALIHDRSVPFVEFFDMRFPQTQFGQFVARYDLDTIMESKNEGLCLDFGVPSWTLTEDSFHWVKAWLRRLELEPA
jgi:hypothetical protein